MKRDVLASTRLRRQTFAQTFARFHGRSGSESSAKDGHCWEVVVWGRTAALVNGVYVLQADDDLRQWVPVFSHACSLPGLQ
jgi:hypothetical protein